MNDKKYIPVKVALRCRPLVQKEIDSGCEQCIHFIPNQSQVTISSRPFTYDYVFDSSSTQNEIFNNTIYPLIDTAFEGYNITILAYGQTGSGKTHTMGTNCFNISENEIEQDEDVGIIPKTINEIFKFIEKSKSNNSEENTLENSDSHFQISISFLEIYKEDVIDLLADPLSHDKEAIVIREDPVQGIKLIGIKEVNVENLTQTLSYLEMGSAVRSTASTAMNSTSSRSHAIFSMGIEKFSNDIVVSQSKFHFVDLAGSERVKKTMAEGERFKEGVNINRGLLALGNVINALSEDAKKKGENSFVPYRDSKLTRILQDSLGGNSHTIMIACVSPADSNIEESLNTLRYADRARKIKNRPVINVDPIQEELSKLRMMVKQLESELLQYKMQGGLFADPLIISQKSDEVQIYKNQLDKLTLAFRTSLEENILRENEREMLKKEVEFYKQKYKFRQSATTRIDDTNCQQVPADQTGDENELTRELEALEKEKEQFLDNFKTLNDQREEDGNDSPIKDRIEELLNQADLNMELKSVSQAISDKEILIKKMLVNEDEIVAIKEKYEKEVVSLQQEKETLTLALQEAKNKNFKELSEKRRQRLMELEGEILTMRKKIADHEKLIKIREENKQLIGKLQVDILDLKQARVRLMHKMKDESSKYRKINQEKEKEVIRLKTNTRKREIAYTQKEQQYKVQQAVLRRKNEEIISANKRLKDALAKRQEVAAMKSQHAKSHQSSATSLTASVKDNKTMVISNGGNSKAALVGEIIERTKDECNLRVWHRIAKKHIEQLINERRDLVEQMKELAEEMAEEPCSKKRSRLSSNTNDDGEDFTPNEAVKSIVQDPIKKERTEAQLASFQNEINMKSQQLAAVQKQVMDVDQYWENKSSLTCPWEPIGHVDPSIKQYLEWFLNAYIDSKVECTTEFTMRTDLVDAHRTSLQQTTKEVEEVRLEMKALKRQHECQMDNLRKENEERIRVILKQTGSLIMVDDHNTPEATQKLLNQLLEQEKIIENQRSTIEAFNKQLGEKEEEIMAYEQEFHRITELNLPPRLFTPIGVKTRKLNRSRRTQAFKNSEPKLLSKVTLSPDPVATTNGYAETDLSRISSVASEIAPADHTFLLSSTMNEGPSPKRTEASTSTTFKSLRKDKENIPETSPYPDAPSEQAAPRHKKVGEVPAQAKHLLRVRKINKYDNGTFFSPHSSKMSSATGNKATHKKN